MAVMEQRLALGSGGSTMTADVQGAVRRVRQVAGFMLVGFGDMTKLGVVEKIGWKVLPPFRSQDPGGGWSDR